MSKKAYLLSHLETVLVAFVIAAMTAANSWHIISRFQARPPSTVFIGITHYHEDYFYYLSQVTQGSLGAWQVSNLYTGEALPPQPLWWPNIFLGKIAALTGLPPSTVYSLSVIVTAAVSLIAVYAVARFIYPADRKKRVATFLLATTTTTFYTVAPSPGGSLSVIPYEFFYNYTASLNRLGGVFHLMLQNVLSVLMIAAGARLFGCIFTGRIRKPGFVPAVIAVALSAFFLAFINPVYILVNCLSLAVTAVILTAFFRPALPKLLQLTAAGATIAVLLTIPAMAMQNALKEPYFQYFRWWETNIKRVTPEEFFLSMGPLAVLAVIGLIPFLRRLRPARLLGVVWTILPLTIYFTLIPIRFQFPFFRLPQPPQYIFLAALATEALWLPAALVARFSGKRPAAVLFSAVIALFVLVQIPAIRVEVEKRNTSHALQSWLNYMDPGVLEAMAYLKNSPDRRLVLAINNTELIIPAFSGRTVYVGHHSITMNYPGKIGLSARFFSRSMTEPEARGFLRDNNIGQVVWRKADGDPGLLVSVYPFLTAEFSNQQMAVFGVPQ